MTPGSCSVMNCPTTSASLALRSNLCDQTGLFAEEIIGHEIERGRRLSSAIGGPTHAKPNAGDGPDTVAGAGVGASVESNGASMLPGPAPSVTASMLDASTLPVSASIAFCERKARFANADHLRRGDAR